MHDTHDVLAIVPVNPAIPLAEDSFYGRVIALCDAVEDGIPVDPHEIDVLRSMTRRRMNPGALTLVQYGRWTGEKPGQGHFLWSGPTDKKTGVPIMNRWRDDDGKLYHSVPVYRILWPYCRTDALIGRPRKLSRCDNPLCAAPLCYDIVVPMHTDGRPENTRSKRFRRDTGGSRRPVWRGDTEIRDGSRVAVCSGCHMPLGFPLTAFSEYIGKQVACKRCEAEDDDLRTRAGLRNPDVAYRWAPKVNPYVERALISEEEAQRIEARNAHDDEVLAQLEREADELMDEEEEAYGPGQ